MIVKHATLTAVLCLGAWCLHGQDPTWTEVLTQIEQNNTELKSYRTHLEAGAEARQAEQGLNGPSIGGYYMPWGEHTSGDYWEVEATQTFAFPTLYGAQRATRSAQALADAQAYALRRQAVLWEAQQVLMQQVHCQKRKQLAEGRRQRAERMLRHTEGRFAAEEVNRVALHQAQLALLEAEMQVEDWEHQYREAGQRLAGLNGGQPLTVTLAAYPDRVDSVAIIELWEQVKARDPALRQAQAQVVVAEHQQQEVRHAQLPQLTLGANYQGVPSEGYGGVYAGISLPLWKTQPAQAAAQRRLEAEQLALRALEETTRAQWEQEVMHYHHKVAQYYTYQATLAQLEAEDFLMEAYTLGHLSFTEYARELEYYQDAQETLLSIEYDLQKLRAGLLKFEL